MEKVLEKTVKREVKKTDYNDTAIKHLMVLNNSLTERANHLTTQLNEYKVKLDQVANRLGL